MTEEDQRDRMITEDDKSDPILRDVGPYCSDLLFIRDELKLILSNEDPVEYLESRINEEKGSRKNDLRILLNRLTKKEGRKITA